MDKAFFTIIAELIEESTSLRATEISVITKLIGAFVVMPFDKRAQVSKILIRAIDEAIKFLEQDNILN